MKLKIIISIVCLFLAILTIGAACASDDMEFDISNLTYTDVADESMDLSSADEADKLSDSEKSFSDIQTLVDGADEGATIDLSGNYAGSGIQITIEKPLTINGNGATLDAKNSSRAFYITADNVVLNNINFVNCYQSSRYDSVYGGALYLKGSYNSIVNCTFTGCGVSTSSNEDYANGGAIYLDGAHGVIDGCKFDNCNAKNIDENLYYHCRGVSSHGGAIYINSGADYASIKKCSFKNTLAYSDSYSQDIRGWSSDTSSYSYGGAIYWNGAYGTLADSDFENTRAYASAVSGHSTHSSDSAAYSFGGAVNWNGAGGSITNCDFVNTSAVATAVAGYGNTDFSSTTYGYGGALYLKCSSMSISGCRFVDSIVDIKSGCVNIGEGGINWDVSGTSSIYSVHGYGGAICFDNNCNGKVIGSSFVDCSVNGNKNMVIANAKSISGCSFNPKISTTLTASQKSVTYGTSEKIVFKLKDASGNPLKSAKVTIKVGSISKTITTDNNGQAALVITSLTPKIYSAKISFAGDGCYKATSATIKVTVKKATPILTAKAKTFKKSKKIKKYQITLKANKKAMKKVKLYLKVNGKTYTAKTNSKGKATFKITKLNKKGTFKAKITFKGNTNYMKVTKTIKIKCK